MLSKSNLNPSNCLSQDSKWNPLNPSNSSLSKFPSKSLNQIIHPILRRSSKARNMENVDSSRDFFFPRRNPTSTWSSTSKDRGGLVSRADARFLGARWPRYSRGPFSLSGSHEVVASPRRLCCRCARFRFRLLDPSRVTTTSAHKAYYAGLARFSPRKRMVPCSSSHATGLMALDQPPSTPSSIRLTNFLCPP